MSDENVSTTGVVVQSKADELPVDLPPLPAGARAPKVKLPPNARPPPGLNRVATLTPEQQLERKRLQTKRLHKQITTALFRVVAPVVLCMLLSIYLVHSLGSGECRNTNTSVQSRVYRPPGLDQFLTSNIFPPAPLPPTESNTSDIISIILLSVFAVSIVVMTFVLVLLYKYHCEWILFVWLILAVIIILGYEGGLYFWEWCRSVCFPMDWITLGLLAWNFAIVGVAAIFWRVPRLVNQTFLILLSGLMAWVFSAWEEWAAWTLLGILVVWDLIAVLTPCGPLRMLIAAAKERGDPLPALVYDTNPGDVGRDHEAKDLFSVIKFRKKKRPDAENADDEEEGMEAQQTVNDSGVSAAGAIGMCVEVGNIDLSNDSSRNSHPTQTDILPAELKNSETEKTEANGVANGNTVGGTATVAGADGLLSPQSPPISPRKLQFNDEGTQVAKAVSGEQVGFLGTHLKLGLGDFVFYSLLVATSSRNSVMTTVTSFVAILSGLCLTLFLLVMFRKPLPALPISITLGIIFNFVTRYTIQPFVSDLFSEMLYT
mmetsp:Transcript_9329/g.16807  ORF Transcript_9329/g.16807 Transcript_9329/m.16807 type:complete len:544 (+) Transcript_9329:97-1728(+)